MAEESRRRGEMALAVQPPAKPDRSDRSSHGWPDRTPYGGPTRRRPPRSQGVSFERYPRRRRWDPATFEADDSTELSERARNAGEWIVVMSTAIVGALLINAFVVQAFMIPSESMEPALMVDDRVVVNKVSHHITGIDHGDIVVFDRPPSETDPTITHLIKRVIGLPGDTLEERNGLIYRNGKIVRESYLPAGTITRDLPSTRVPEGRLFVMGDNRNQSRDSRFFGPIDSDLVVGEAFLRVWPLTSIGPL